MNTGRRTFLASSLGAAAARAASRQRESKTMRMDWFPGCVFTDFCVILMVCYGIAKESHPVFLDQDGHPTNAVAKQ
jgi:hypothetical protein